MMRLLSLILVLSVVAAPAAQAQRRGNSPKNNAQDSRKQKARASFDIAQRAFDLGKFDEALTFYQAAYEELPMPAFLFNIAQCHRNMGNAEQALFFYQRYLSLEPAPPNRPIVEELIAEQQRKLEAARNTPPVEPEPERKVDLTPREAPPDILASVPPAKPTNSGPIWRKPWFIGAVVGVAVVGGLITMMLMDNGRGPSARLGVIDARDP
jgi:tetratricopeptide (TPR) repeat protein